MTKPEFRAIWGSAALLVALIVYRTIVNSGLHHTFFDTYSITFMGISIL